MIAAFMLFALTFIGIIFTVVTVNATREGGRVGAIFSVVFSVLGVVVFGTIIFITVRMFLRRRNPGSDHAYRLDAFARANAMKYRQNLADPPLPGMIFSVGAHRLVREAVYGTEPRFVEIGNYQYFAGSPHNETRTWGYVAVKLNTALPHIVLDATANGKNLDNFVGPGEKLSLEGDFDKHFTLRCQAGSEADALYLFTPDIMAQYIDRAANLDVEIYGEWLFFYSPDDLVTRDPAMWVYLFSLVQTMLTKLDQWERWRAE